ncbi:MAG: (Fe-S)-binding protein [Anaerolineales bacterium]|nr:(Fe-S)-binding protein [Anaerolineales bacterium]
MPEIEGTAQEEVLLINDELWEELIDLTDGAAALCYQCGVCTATCPWGVVKQEHLTVRTLIRQAQLGLQGESGNLWLCTTCAQCEALCPRGVNITGVIRGLRTIAWDQRNTAEGLPSLLWSIFWNNNPWSQPPSQRALWAKHLNIPDFDPQEHEVLLYIGCTSSYDQRAQKIAAAITRLLNCAGVKFGYLGDEEPCCGEAALSVGHKGYFDELAAQTAHIFQERGVAKIVTISPHCFDVFQNHYPEFSEDFKPLHYTQFLANLLDSGHLQFEQPVSQLVTFHDPCYLGRINGEYSAPRQILESIPGVDLLEMEYSAENGLCCGGGGGRMWLETPPGERFSDVRIEQAQQTGANLLATACPFCVTCLEDSIKSQPENHMQVLDIAEIAAQAV